MNAMTPNDYNFTIDISAELEKILRNLTKRIDEEVLRSMDENTFISLLRTFGEEAHRRGILPYEINENQVTNDRT